MPNWCLNKLTVEHEDGAMVDRFVNAYNAGKACNEFLPMPEGIGDGWYDWCINNWGTKWDIGADVGTEKEEWHGLKATRVGNQVTCSFDSAWAPPVGLYEELDKLGFSVDATYFEPGIGFCGIWHDGDDLYTDYGGDKGIIPVKIWEDYNLGEFCEDDEIEA
jgi:hypothetical protein